VPINGEQKQKTAKKGWTARVAVLLGQKGGTIFLKKNRRAKRFWDGFDCVNKAKKLNRSKCVLSKQKKGFRKKTGADGGHKSSKNQAGGELLFEREPFVCRGRTLERNESGPFPASRRGIEKTDKKKSFGTHRCFPGRAGRK